MFFKRDKKDDCMIAGMVVVDLKEKEYNDNIFYEFGVGFGKDENGNDLPIVNVTTWGRKIDVQKYDRVFVCGHLKTNQKDDKTYYSLNADFVMKENCQKRQTTPKDLTPVDDDDSLPF